MYIIKFQYWQLFQEENLKMNWQENQDSTRVERQARDLEVRVRIPVQVQIFLLKCKKRTFLCNIQIQFHGTSS